MQYLLLVVVAASIGLSSSLSSNEGRRRIPFTVVKPGTVKAIDLFGPNLNITIGSRDVTIRSPLLLFSDSNAVLKVIYNLTNPVDNVKVSTFYRCYRDLEGRFIVKWWRSFVPFELRNVGSNLQKCVPMLADKDYLKLISVCKTIRISMTLSIRIGLLAINEMSFIDKNTCQGVVKTTTSCDFDTSDSGVRNNFCGLKDWTIQDRTPSNHVARRWVSSTCSQRKKGYPLQKSKLLTLQCIFPLCIPCLQYSGYSIIKKYYKIPTVKSTFFFNGKRQSSGRVLSLDPAGVVGEMVGPAVADLSEVQHDPVNAVLSLQYEMLEGGLHYLMIAAVCTSSPFNDLLPLGPDRLHFLIPHFDRAGRAGTICLDIHTFVTSDVCSTFAIQLQAGAIDTAITVDNVDFASNLESTICSGFANTG